MGFAAVNEDVLQFVRDLRERCIVVTGAPDCWVSPLAERLACEIAGRPYKLQVAPRWLLRLMGIFVSDLRENDEMMYQFENDYIFDSTRISAEYGLQPTPYREGMAATLRA